MKRVAMKYTISAKDMKLHPRNSDSVPPNATETVFFYVNQAGSVPSNLYHDIPIIASKEKVTSRFHRVLGKCAVISTSLGQMVSG